MSALGTRAIVLFDRVGGRGAYKLHLKLYKATGGRIGAKSPYGPMLLLTTTGRVSGQERTNPLLYMPHGDRFVVVASNGGRPEAPNWYRNLLATPEAVVQVANRTLNVVSSTPVGEERERLWAEATSFYPGWAHYQTITDRDIPVVELVPAAS